LQLLSNRLPLQLYLLQLLTGAALPDTAALTGAAAHLVAAIPGDPPTL
jgi:hypothetical protein